jgi:hypothetical protein
MQPNSALSLFISGLVCLIMVFAIPIGTSLQAETLKDHRCVYKGYTPATGGVGCVSGSVGPNAPCLGSVVTYNLDYQCEYQSEGWSLDCKKVKLKKTEYFGVVTELGLVTKAGCYGVPVICVGCAVAAVVAGAYSAGGGYVIGAGICSVIGCAGMTFFNPLECCYKECSVSEDGKKSDWKDGCSY